MNKNQMEMSGASEIEILRAEIAALWEIVEELPVDTHDLQVHFWCDHVDPEE